MLLRSRSPKSFALNGSINGGKLEVSKFEKNYQTPTECAPFSENFTLKRSSSRISLSGSFVSPVIKIPYRSRTFGSICNDLHGRHAD